MDLSDKIENKNCISPKYILCFTDGYTIDCIGKFSTLEMAQTAMKKDYDHFAPHESNWNEDFREISEFGDFDAILYRNGEDVFVWHIEEIQF